LNPLTRPVTSLVRSACLTNFADIAARCSLDARALLNEVGLPARALEDPDLKVPALAVGRLLELAAARGGEPAFGLRMAESRRLSNLGYLGMLARDEPTLRSALEALMQNIRLHTDALALRLEQEGELVSLHEELVTEDGESLRQFTELIVASTYGVLRILMGERWRPRLVCFSHRAPRSDLMHRRAFGKAVEFEHPFNGIVVSASDLDAVNPGADPGMVRYARALLKPVLGAQAPLSDRIRQLAVLLLPRGQCRVEVVAQELGVDRRTVARGLASEGTTFSRLIDDMRRELLLRHLRARSQSLANISTLLGFSSPSAFARWHRRQFGVTARSRLR
jgi:AraC-like DNA-binding protein